MEEKAKSMIVGRKKISEDLYNSIITLFDIENPHLSTDMPKKTLEFRCAKVEFSRPIKFDFLTNGNDIVINGISSVRFEEKKEQEELIVEIVQE